MGRVAYSLAQKAEAVALASVIGSDAAAAQLGMTARAIRGWSEKAGKGPELAVDPDSWRTLMDLALARVMAKVASGKVTTVQLATVAAIAGRNAAKPVTAPAESSVTAKDAFVDWFFAEVVGDDLSDDELEALTDDELDDAVHRMDAKAPSVTAWNALMRDLLRRANAEPGSGAGDSAPIGHRLSILAWFSGRTEVMAGDVLEWAQDQTRAILAEHGSLEGLRLWEEAQREASRVAYLAQGERNRQAAIAYQQKSLDDEARALVEAAEAWLAANTEPAA